MENLEMTYWLNYLSCWAIPMWSCHRNEGKKPFTRMFLVSIRKATNYWNSRLEIQENYFIIKLYIYYVIKILNMYSFYCLERDFCFKCVNIFSFKVNLFLDMLTYVLNVFFARMCKWDKFTLNKMHISNDVCRTEVLVLLCFLRVYRVCALWDMRMYVYDQYACVQVY